VIALIAPGDARRRFIENPVTASRAGKLAASAL